MSDENAREELRALAAAVGRVTPCACSVQRARAERAEAQVAAVEALVRKWSLLAGQAMDNDTREWLNAVVDTLRPILDTPADTPTEPTGCVPCRVCGGSQNRGWHRHDTPAEPDADERHEFVGRLDRGCEVCGRPDRAEIHKRAGGAQ